MATDGKFQALATLIASGRTISSAATELGISRRTAYRNAKKDSFQSRVAAIRDEITSAAVGTLSQAASQAAATLSGLLHEDFEPQIRLNAAKAILASLTPLVELGEIRQRVAKLEHERESVK